MGEPDQHRILLDVALQFAGTVDLDRLLPLVLQQVTALFDAECALFALCDAEGRIEQAVLHNLPWAGPGTPLPVSLRLIREVIDARELRLVPDTAHDADFGTHMSVRIHQIRFMVAAPVMAGDELLGVIYVDNRAGVVSAVEDRIELLQALAGLVAIAVRKVRLFEEQRFRQRLLAAMVHEFRTPLNVISANADLLSSGAVGVGGAADPTDLREMAADIDASVRRMGRIISNTLELSRLDEATPVMAPVAVDLAVEIPAHLRALDVVARSMGAALAVEAAEALPPACTVPEWLWIVLDNLLFNALKNGARGAAVTVRVVRRDDAGPAEALERPVDDAVHLFRRVAPLRPAPDAAFLEVSVHNLGRPVPEELRRDLFRAFVRGEERQRGVHSSGLGLSIVHQCVRHLGGAVWMSSTAEAGTRFAFSLPTRVQPVAA